MSATEQAIQTTLDTAAPGFRDYLVCALWSSVYCGPKEGDDAPEHMDDEVGVYDFDPETLREMAEEYGRFVTDCEEDIDGDYPQAAPDFWLTRNEHGAGFWDGDWPEPEATRLTDYSHKAGSLTVYVGDDGRIYKTT